MFELRLRTSDPAPGGDVVPDLPDDAQVWRDREGVRRAFGYTAPDGVHWIHLPGVPASYRFTSAGDGVEAIAAEETATELIEDAYRRRVLPFALQAQDRELLHASAVELPDGGVIAFCGESGAGKSTMASEFAGRGYTPLADDALLFEVADGTAQVHHLPFAFRLAGANGDGLKESSVVVTEERPAKPLRAVFILDRSPEAPALAPEVTRLARHEAFSLMLYHAHCFSFKDDDRRRRMLERYLELSACVRVFRLLYRPTWEELPGVLDAIEQAAA